MAKSNESSIDGMRIDTREDVTDFRDRWYEPTLSDLAPRVDPPEGLEILDQGREGACTGFGLAAVANLLYARRGADVRVSPRMLYEMAKRYDRWPGEQYDGSSCRGAIKGWYHTGVCRDSRWPYDPQRPGNLTLARAKDARAQTIGAYYRIRKNIVDMHAAINEVGVVYVSANVHSGWTKREAEGGRIAYTAQSRAIGGHAFAVVGYTPDAFVVQNSWGPGWGDGGLATWSYEDWQDNVWDAWVVQLALSTPQLYSRRRITRGSEGAREGAILGPRRDEVAGHFVHIDDGKFHDHGRYWSTLDDVRETAKLVAKSDKYDHLMIYGHGGLNSVKASASRIAAMRDTFKRNRIYPYHFMYDTGLLEEIKDLLLGKGRDAETRAGGFTDWTDTLIESGVRRPGRAIWREMKSDASLAFADRSRPGTQVLQAFLGAFDAGGAIPKKIHLVGHSTGAILHAHLLNALARSKRDVRLSSVSLLAPAATVSLFEQAFLPRLGRRGTRIDDLTVYNLNDRLERDDNVAMIYRKSLLYLVSRAFEEDPDEPEAIVGMERYNRDLVRGDHPRLKFVYSNGVASSRDRTNSTSHGGFDNDPATMNDILKRILGRAPRHPFTRETLDY